MSIALHSPRFGSIEIPDDGVLEFPLGLIGIEGTRYALLGQDDSAFAWLHSLDDPSFALPVMDPWQVFVDYEVQLSDAEATRIGVPDPATTTVYVTVRATERQEECTVNLRAPILISGGRGYQVINEFPAAPLRAPLFPQSSRSPSRTAPSAA
ncbi:MAG: flagellar assembly protein FliW [Patulibacter sp.]